jgi:hypothetical protein
MLESVGNVSVDDLGFYSPKQLENRIVPSDGGQGSGLVDFVNSVELERILAENEGSPFNKDKAVLRHGAEIVSRIGEQVYELGLDTNIDTREFMENMV